MGTIDQIKSHFRLYQREYIQLFFIALIGKHVLNVITLHYTHPSDATRQAPSFKERIYRVMHHTCPVRTKNPTLQRLNLWMKGENYDASGTPEHNKKLRTECLVTPWNVSHFVAQFIITFFYPMQWLAIFMASFLFEIHEYVEYKCQDVSDILYNGLGIGSALLLKRYIAK